MSRSPSMLYCKMRLFTAGGAACTVAGIGADWATAVELEGGAAGTVAGMGADWATAVEVAGGTAGAVAETALIVADVERGTFELLLELKVAELASVTFSLVELAEIEGK